MRLLLVGPLEARCRLRAELDESTFTIAGEFATLSQARASRIDADGILVGGSEAPIGRGSQSAFEEPLTPRELDVLGLLAEGLANKTIAARLGISDQTVKCHVAAICGKLGASNRTDAVRRAIRRGLVSV
jgi:DNA-binding NarL/FixJ family response regulator